MKIELKNTDFKLLCEWLDSLNPPSVVGNCSRADCPESIKTIFKKQLKPQYEKAFLKYKDEKQEFQLREKVTFQLHPGQWEKGFIHKVSRLANGQYRYIVGYEDDNEYNQLMGEKHSYTNLLTKKNIKKI